MPRDRTPRLKPLLVSFTLAAALAALAGTVATATGVQRPDPPSHAPAAREGHAVQPGAAGVDPSLEADEGREAKASKGSGVIAAVGPAGLARLGAAPLLALPSMPDAWVAPGYGDHLIDDFEGPSWPDPDTWVALFDLTSGDDASYLWAPTDCRAADGSSALWAIGGGFGHPGGIACGNTYPAELQTSGLFALDLGAAHSAASLDLRFDIWADAAPTEGVFLNYVSFDGAGRMVERRPVYSATGRSTDWSRGVRVDLTNLRDARDAAWRMDLRGRFAYFEWLFLSGSGGTPGEGIHLDNLALSSEARPPIVVTSPASATPSPTAASTSTPVTPTAAPTPVDRTEACSNEPDCRSLEVRAFVDYRCDGSFQSGVDALVRSEPRVDITAGTELLGTDLDRRGRATFRLPTSAGAEVRLETPDGFRMCDNSPNPLAMAADDFRAVGLTRVYLRIVPDGADEDAASASVRRDRSAESQAYAVAMIDDFEDPDAPPTGRWEIVDDPEPPEYVWGRRDCHALSGDFGFWAVGAGSRGRRLDCGDPYPEDIRSLVVLELDLTAYAEAGVLHLVWDAWANTLSDAPLGDFFSINLLRPGAEPGFEDRLPVFDWTGYTGERFVRQELDLLRLQNRFNPGTPISVAGESSVRFQFIFRSNRDSTTRPEGITIDDVRLEHDLGPPATATPGPTFTPTATRVPTRTPTAATPPDVHLPIAVSAPLR